MNLNVDISEEAIKLAKAKSSLIGVKITEYINNLILKDTKHLEKELKNI